MGGGGKFAPPLKTTFRAILGGIIQYPPKHLKNCGLHAKNRVRNLKNRKMAAILKKISDGGRHVHDFVKKSYFIFYKYNQGLVFCKHPNLYRRLILEKEKIYFFFSFLRGDQISEGGLGGPPLNLET